MLAERGFGGRRLMMVIREERFGCETLEAVWFKVRSL